MTLDRNPPTYSAAVGSATQTGLRTPAPTPNSGPAPSGKAPLPLNGQVMPPQIQHHSLKPLILTLALDRSTHSFLTSLRAKYFPKERNHLAAHLTLFHAIPGHRLPELERQIEHFTTRPGFDVRVLGPEKMGSKGVMLRIESTPRGAVEGIHGSILREMKRGIRREKTVTQDGQEVEQEVEQDKLTNQDSMRLTRPHVTILNKVRDEQEIERCMLEVGEVFGQLEGGVKRGRAVGFEVWEYMGGPWKLFRQYWFTGEGERQSGDPI